MTIEPVRAFNRLDVLVARDAGLFAVEGLDLRITALAPEGMLERRRLALPAIDESGTARRP